MTKAGLISISDDEEDEEDGVRETTPCVDTQRAHIHRVSTQRTHAIQHWLPITSSKCGYTTADVCGGAPRVMLSAPSRLSLQEEEEEAGRQRIGKRAAKRMRKEVEQHIEEYYKLDYEDLVGGVPCRFKYKTVLPKKFGLKTEQMLGMTDKELQQARAPGAVS